MTLCSRTWLRMLLVLVSFMLLAGVEAAAAETGEPVAVQRPIDATPGVSVAFDGTYLYFTNQGDATAMYRRLPLSLDATPSERIPLVPPTELQAISYDSVHDVFWGADRLYNIYLVTRTGEVTLLYNIEALLTLYGFCDGGCFNEVINGLGYDATDDTFWYSPDNSQRIYHFEARRPTLGDLTTLVPSLVGFFDVNEPESWMLPECETTGDAGIGVGAGALYLNNSLCSTHFFAYGKSDYLPTCPDPLNVLCEEPRRECEPVDANYCPGVKKFAVPYQGLSPQDSECDDVTFPQGVIWMRDFLDNGFRAYEVPSTEPCIFGGGVRVELEPDERRVTGGGWLPAVTPLGATAHFGTTLRCNELRKPQQLQVSWGDGNRFHMLDATRIECSPPTLLESGEEGLTITGEGVGRYNGQNDASVQFSFTDNGEPGTNDTARIEVRDAAGVPVLEADGVLLGGNVQSHRQ